VEKYTYQWLRDENYEGQAAYVIERRPIDRNSGYTRQEVWIDKEHYRLLKVDYYDRKQSLLKTLKSSGFKLYLDKIWRPEKMSMYNHQTRKSTDLLWREYRFNTGLTDKDFTRNSLQRAR
ncbi:MAG: outer membrane lipoprotein-sorting protein, partial [Pseudomonadota bacterium]|nr:outer membrane lipoprotein-sorting protein [Pseudomonadota bacterium]